MTEEFLIANIYSFDGKSDDYVKNIMLKTMVYSRSCVTMISGRERKKTYFGCLIPISDIKARFPKEILDAANDFADTHNVRTEGMCNAEKVAIYDSFSMCDNIGFSFDIVGAELASSFGICYTDGSASFTRKIGGWGLCVLKKPTGIGNEETHIESVTGHIKAFSSYSGVCEGGTNNIGELTGIKEAILRSDNHHNQIIVSDSEYAISSLRDWLEGWKIKGMRTSSGSQVANCGLILDIDKAIKNSGKRFFFKWVKGHTDSMGECVEVDEFNVICDRLAGSATAKVK